MLAQAAHRTPPGSSALRESEASAAMFYLCESEASATNVLSVRKRSDSNNKAPSRNGNQPHVMVMSQKRENKVKIIDDSKRDR
jgi:hypothetical protein